MDGRSVAAGNGKLMDELGVKWQDCHSVGTIVHMAVDGEYAGHIVISDVVKTDARDAIAALKRAGVQKTVMLTGDTQSVADHVAQELGVDEVHSRAAAGRQGRAGSSELLGEKAARMTASPSSATASTTRPCSPARISASPWARWAPTPPLRQRTLC